MFNLIKRDLKIIFGTKSILLLILFSVPLYQFLMVDMVGYGNIMIAIILIYSVTTYSFGLDAKNNSHILFKSLPISDWESVISKYILALINLIFIIAYIIVITILMSYLRFGEYNFNSLSRKEIIYTVMVTLISLSISLPLIFFSSPKIGDFLGRLAMFITAFTSSSSVYIGKYINTPLLDRFNSTKFIIIVIGGIYVSIALSIYIHSQKEFKR